MAVLTYRAFVFPWVKKKVPYTHGLRIFTYGSNAQLFHDRIASALNQLHLHAPIYLKWLRYGFRVLCTEQFFLILRTKAEPVYLSRLLVLSPRAVWRHSPEELAVYLAGYATLARLGPRFRGRAASIVRGGRVAVREMLNCARLLPGTAAMVTQLEDALASEP